MSAGEIILEARPPRGGGLRQLWWRLRRRVLRRRPKPMSSRVVSRPAVAPAEESDEFIEPRGTTARCQPIVPKSSATRQVIQQVSDGLSQVPPLPHVVRELLVELQDPDSTAHSVARIAASDPALAACLLRTVNSVAFGLRRKITSVSESVSYLGYTIVRSLVVRMRLEHMLLPRRGAGDLAALDAEDLWIHSLAVSYAADCLADRAGGVDRGLVATLGLLHDIGKLVINSQFPDSAARLRSRDGLVYGQSALERERQVLGADHAEIGAILAKHWKLPDELIESIRWHHEPAQATAAAMPPDVRRAMLLVHLANQLTKYCYVYGDDVEIDIVPDELLRELGFVPPITRLLNDRVRQAISRAIFFADEANSRPLSAIRRFIRLHEPNEATAALRWASTSGSGGHQRIKWADATVNDSFERHRRRLKSVTSVAGIKSLIDAAGEQQNDLGMDETALLPARFCVRWLLPNLTKLSRDAQPVEVANWQYKSRLMLAVRSPVLAFANRFEETAERASCRRVLERELGNVLNLRWFSEVRVTPDGGAIVFIGHAPRPTSG
jgi:putative nucleotidyltransferase with HDIG domain